MTSLPGVSSKDSGKMSRTAFFFLEALAFSFGGAASLLS